MTAPITLVAERSALVDHTQELIHEFAGRLPAGQVIACVLRCRELLEHSGVRAGMATAATAMARARLLMWDGPGSPAARTFGPGSTRLAVVS